jgi:hypothetical protein
VDIRPEDLDPNLTTSKIDVARVFNNAAMALAELHEGNLEDAKRLLVAALSWVQPVTKTAHVFFPNGVGSRPVAMLCRAEWQALIGQGSPVVVAPIGGRDDPEDISV